MTKLSPSVHSALGRALRPDAYARRKERERVRRLKDKEITAALRASGALTAAYSRAPPDHVIEERDRALAGTRDLSAIAFGDPLPGRSALDRRT